MREGENTLSPVFDRKNLEKLLEIYGEPGAVNTTPVQHAGLLQKLKVWQGTAGLKKVAEALTGL